MTKAVLLAIAVAGSTLWVGHLSPADAHNSALEMQGQRRSTAMTPQRARRECWQQFGVAPGSPRNAYRATLQPQVEACVSQKMRR